MKKIKLSGKFSRKRDWLVIPDLHGTSLFAPVVAEIAALDLNLVQLGDIIDVREPGCSNMECLEAVMELKRLRPDLVMIRGNHEQDFLNAVHGGMRPPYSSPEDGWLSAYDEIMGKKGYIPHELVNFLEATVLFHEVKHLLFLHGGYELLKVEKVAKNIPVNQLLWAYRVAATWQGKKIVRGHRVVELPEEWPNHINCEAGGWMKGRKLRLSIVRDWKEERKLMGCLEIGKCTRKLVVYGHERGKEKQ
jgi:Calcineurin-like phosphoesterase